MRNKKSILFSTLLFLLLAFCLSGCNGSDSIPPQATEEEIMLIIQLDLKEDIGLLILDTNMDGVEASGGISNADRSLLKHNEVLYWTFSKQEYKNTVDSVNLSVRFRVIMEYCDPNYENDYPEEYTVLLDPISYKADFGETYHVSITGDKEKGYQAELLQ